MRRIKHWVQVDPPRVHLSVAFDNMQQYLVINVPVHISLASYINKPYKPEGGND